MQGAHGTASSMRKQKRKGESGGTERAAGGQGASLLLLVRGAIYRSLQRGQKIAKRWGGGRARVHSSPLPSSALSPKDPAGRPFHHTPGSRQAREAPPEQPRLRGLTCTPLILTVASTFPSPSRVRPASLPSTSALGPSLGAGHSLSTLCGTPTWAPKH